MCPRPVWSLNALKRLKCEKIRKNIYSSIRILYFAYMPFLIQTKLLFHSNLEFMKSPKNEDIYVLCHQIGGGQISRTYKRGEDKDKCCLVAEDI